MQSLSQLLSQLGPFLPYAVSAAGALLLAIFGLGYAKLSRWLAEHTKLALLSRINDAVYSAVKDTAQTYVNEIKAASEDGKITKDEQAIAMERTLSKLKSYLSFAEIGKVLEIGSLPGVETFLASKAEAALHDIEQAKAGALGQAPKS